MIGLKTILPKSIKEQFEDMKLSDFAQKRFGGAEKIANDAKEKGGPSILTYHHFVVKLPFYKEAAEGKFDESKALSQYNSYMDSLHKLMENPKPDPIEFQKLVGLLEVLGELIIKNKTGMLKEEEYKVQNAPEHWTHGKDQLIVTKGGKRWVVNFNQFKEPVMVQLPNGKGMRINTSAGRDAWFKMRDSVRSFLAKNESVKEDCGCNKTAIKEDWSQKYKNSIDCNNPKGFSQRAHCQGKKKSEVIGEAIQLFLEKNCPTDPEKWSASKAAAKSKFDVYPSAYANGWAAKNYKEKGGGWKKCDEGMANALCEDCWDGYKQIGMKNKGGKQVPNCVPEVTIKEGRGVKSVEKDLSKVLDAIQSELEKYKASKGTPKEKTHIANLKTLNSQKAKLTAELDMVVSGLYKDAELKAED